jgi:hypothetical protein
MKGTLTFKKISFETECSLLHIYQEHQIISNTTNYAALFLLPTEHALLFHIVLFMSIHHFSFFEIMYYTKVHRHKTL